MSGIKIGTVTALQLDPQSYYANAEFTIGGDIELPDDTSAKITSEGLLGGNYVSLSLVAAKTCCPRVMKFSTRKAQSI